MRCKDRLRTIFLIHHFLPTIFYPPYFLPTVFTLKPATHFSVLAESYQNRRYKLKVVIGIADIAIFFCNAFLQFRFTSTSQTINIELDKKYLCVII